jgi:2-oxoisovalerate dehydrogenase E1 component
LKIVYPAFPGDAKGLLNAAIEDPNPVLFFEHKYLYRSIKEDVSDEYYTLEIGKARTVKAGNNISVITYGLGVHWALEAAEKHPELDLDIIDLRSLAPLDTQAIYDSVLKTGKVIVLHEDSLTGGIGGEIASLINENCFNKLDAPVKRIGSLDTPIPFAADLEQNFLPKQRFIEALITLDNY